MDKEPDLLAIRLVALDGHQMPLVKEDRIEAIKLMSANNIPREQIAWRLCMNVDALEKFTKRKRIKLPEIRPPAHWTSSYVDFRNAAERRRNAERKQQIRADQKRETCKQESTS